MTHHDHDAIVIGAGFGGLYELLLLKERGLNVRLLEKGGGIGGTWFWNRYPGAASDTEAFAYRYFFDDEFLAADSWKNRYLSQPEVLEYLARFVDHYELRPQITLGTEVVAAHWNDADDRWEVRTANDESFTAKVIVTALGLLARVNIPAFPGLDDFEGRLVHTGEWPADLDLAGKRVGVIGTGSTGTQVITAAAKVAGELTVFQRRPQYSVPSGNRPLEAGELDAMRGKFADVRRQMWGSHLAYGFEESHREFGSTPEAERERIFEAAWQEGNAFRFMFETFGDVAVDPEANEAAAAFVRRKIAEIVEDPETARLLTPTEPYARRPICNHGYYETFNRDNVHLVSVLENPIERVLANGIQLADGSVHEIDVLVLATGFDAVDGNYLRLDLRGRGGVRIQDSWANGPDSYLGICVPDYPNMFMILGPNGPFCNLPPAIETQARWIADAAEFITTKRLARLEASSAAQAAWTETCDELATQSLFAQTESWIFGANIPGKPHRVMFYMAGLSDYVERIDSEAREGYPNFEHA